MTMTETDADAPTIAPAVAPIECRVVGDSEALDQLQPGWEALSSILHSPMETFGWSAAAVSLAGAERPRLVVAEQNGLFRAIAPLAVCRGLSIGRFAMLGMEDLNEPGDFVFADPEALDSLVRRAIDFRRPILLGRLPAESPTIEAFLRRAKGRGAVIVRERASCPYIPLDDSWLEPERHLSSRRRSDFRRARRRAEQQGEIKSEVVEPSPAELDKLLELAFAVEARSWKGTAGTALSTDPIRGPHLRRFSAWASRAGILRICLLHIGEATAAMQIAVEQNSALWLLKIGFDPAFAGCSPGNLLLAASIRYAAERKLSSLEFLGTVEPWTKVWTEHERRCVSLRYYPFNLHGAAGFLADAAAKFIRGRRPADGEQTTGGRSDGSPEPSHGQLAGDSE